MDSKRMQAILNGRCPHDLTYADIEAASHEWRESGQSIAFTNGCFDVLHEGHLELLKEARRRADRLIIALNPDDWIARHKGAGRPVQSADIRRAVAHAMAEADLSIVFEDETAERLLQMIRPDFYVIGSDYRGVPILGAENCGEIVIMERLPGVSTTATITRIRQSQLDEGI